MSTAAVPAAIWLVLWISFLFVVLPRAAPTDAYGGMFGFDFRDTMWLPIRDFLHGNLPWDYAGYSQRYPFAQVYPLYTPSYWWPALVFQALPYRTGLTLWIGACTGSLVFLVSWAARRLGGATGWRSWFLVLTAVGFLAFARAGRSGLITGNWAIPCAAAAAVALSGRVRGWRLVLCLMVAMVKPQVGIALLVVCLVRRQWRPVLLTLAATTALCLPITVVAAIRAGGIAHLIALGVELVRIGTGPGTGPGLANSTQIDLTGTMQHLLPDLGMPWTAILLLLAASVTLVGYARAWRTTGAASAEAMVLGGLAVAIVLPNLIYAVTVVVPGLVIMVWRLLVDRRDLGQRRIVISLVAVLLIVAALGNTGPAYSVVGIWPQLANFLTGMFLFLAATVLALGTQFSQPAWGSSGLSGRGAVSGSHVVGKGERKP